MNARRQGRIAIASDHRGVSLKTSLVEAIRGWGGNCDDLGPSTDSEKVDYPDYAARVARAVAEGDAERGILICGSGIGMSIAANKIDGIRAALCRDARSAEMARSHNDANVLVLSGDWTEPEDGKRIVKVWLNGTFSGGRHARRVEKVRALEREEA